MESPKATGLSKLGLESRDNEANPREAVGPSCELFHKHKA